MDLPEHLPAASRVSHHRHRVAVAGQRPEGGACHGGAANSSSNSRCNALVATHWATSTLPHLTWARIVLVHPGQQIPVRPVLLTMFPTFSRVGYAYGLALLTCCLQRRGIPAKHGLVVALKLMMVLKGGSWPLLIDQSHRDPRTSSRPVTLAPRLFRQPVRGSPRDHRVRGRRHPCCWSRAACTRSPVWARC